MNRNTKSGLLGSTTHQGGVYDSDDTLTLTPQIISTSSATNSSTITLPSNIVAGQFIVIFVQSSTTVAATPSGYTRTVATSLGSPYLGIFTKTAVGTEGGTTVTVSSTNSPSACVVLNRGVIENVGTPLRAVATSGTVPGIATNGNSLVFLMAGTDVTTTSDPNLNVFFNLHISVIDSNDKLAIFYRRFNSTPVPDTIMNWVSAIGGIMISIK